MQEINEILANKFQIKPIQVKNTIKLIDGRKYNSFYCTLS